ncbi:MAG: OsmC family protein [Casimicrobiaceae bacterium]
MTAQEIAAALRRVEAVVQRRPDFAMQEEAPASARWEGGTRIVASHANGTRMATDMPREFGGAGNDVTPGWLFRAGFASCAATCIAMGAAAKGIELTSLEVLATSKSDIRGLLGMADAGGEPVHAGPRDVQLVVRISAAGVDPARLRALVEDSYCCSPISSAVRSAVPVDLHIEIGDS